MQTLVDVILDRSTLGMAGLALLFSQGFAGLALAAEATVSYDRASGRVQLTHGRLELRVETRDGLNPNQLRDTLTGTAYADSDYVWPGGRRPALSGPPEILQGADGAASVRFRARLGALGIVHLFSTRPDLPDAISETVTVTNTGSNRLVTADFRVGFAKTVREGETWAHDAETIHFCGIPYRRETDGALGDFPLKQVVEQKGKYQDWQETLESPTWGAEGWVWSRQNSSLLIAKYAPDNMEWSLLTPVVNGKTVLCFGGAGLWKKGSPEKAAALAPGQSFTFGETLLRVVAGDWKDGYYAYRGFLESQGCRLRPGFNPPVHWNELYDNDYFQAVCAALAKTPREQLPDFLTRGNVELLRKLYSLEAMKAEAAKAKELGCEALYLDPGWDTGPSHHVWDAARLGSVESFVELMRKEYGLKTSLWVGLAGAPPTFADPLVLPRAAWRLDQDGIRPWVLCVPSPVFRDAKKKLLTDLARKGIAFMMFDSTTYNGPCYDPAHGHSLPSTREEHANAVWDILSAVKRACPETLIELHDPVTGPSSAHYTPAYFFYARENSFDSLWGHEFMWNSMDDLLSGRARSLYYYNLAYSIPLYLHVGLKTDNANALVFWWYASTCRHLGVGGKPQDPAVWAAQKAAMRVYLPLKRFYTHGAFYGLDETAHAHTLPQARASVLNVFNLTGQPQIRTLTFALSEIGLPAGVATVENAAAEQHDGSMTLRVPVPALGHALVKVEVQEDAARPLFRKAGADRVEDFAAVSPAGTVDVVNAGTAFLMVVFEANAAAKLSPRVVRLPPNGRTNVRLEVRPGVESFVLRYAVATSSTAFRTHSYRYRAYSDGETVGCVPVAPGLQAAMAARTRAIVNKSTIPLTDPDMPAGTRIYTPGPFYREAGLFGRDFLYQLEGSGRDTVTADEVRQAVDWLALKQLPENRKVGDFTCPKGAIPDHVYPDGRYGWGPGTCYGDVARHFNRPSMDEAMCFITLAWHYGYKAGWDAAWQRWFTAKTARFEDAWNSVPLNPKTGLVTQWTTPGRTSPQGIAETNGACVMWGFHDSYGFGGDDLGTSVLACNAARALADMHDRVAHPAAANTWSARADAMRDSIRAQFNPAGYLPWGVGPAAPGMASPDITGHAVWSGILSEEQADAASDWFAARYQADRMAGGAADLFQMTPGLRGAVRMARKADDVAPGRHVWPDMTPPQWENLAYGYNAYQDGGYWYYMSLGVAQTLWRKHAADAIEWVTDAYINVTTADENHPCERIDGNTPVNSRYNASVGSLLGMGLPANVYSVPVTVAGGKPGK